MPSFQRFSYVQTGFGEGEARLPEVYSDLRTRSVLRLENYYVTRGETLRRRPGTVLEHEFTNEEFFDGEGNSRIAQVFPFGPPGHYLYRLNNYRIGLIGPASGSGRRVVLKCFPFQRSEYEYKPGNPGRFDSNDAQPSDTGGGKNQRKDYDITIAGKKLGNLLNSGGGYVGIKKIVKTSGGFFLLPEEGFPFIARWDPVNNVVSISPYYWRDPKSYLDIVRAYPLNNDPIEFKDVLYKGNAVDTEPEVKLFIGEDNDIEGHTCEAWLGVSGNYTGNIKKDKMALQEFIGKPLYFNVLPKNPIAIANSFEKNFSTPSNPQTDKTVTERFVRNVAYDEATDFTGTLLTNLNTRADIANFVYGNLLDTQGNVIGFKEDVIRSLLYDRKYMIIPYAVVEDGAQVDRIDPTEDPVSYASANSAGGVLVPAITTSRLLQIGELHSIGEAFVPDSSSIFQFKAESVDRPGLARSDEGTVSATLGYWRRTRTSSYRSRSSTDIVWSNSNSEETDGRYVPQSAPDNSGSLSLTSNGFNISRRKITRIELYGRLIELDRDRGSSFTFSGGRIYGDFSDTPNPPRGVDDLEVGVKIKASFLTPFSRSPWRRTSTIDYTFKGLIKKDRGYVLIYDARVGSGFSGGWLLFTSKAITDSTVFSRERLENGAISNLVSPPNNDDYKMTLELSMEINGSVYKGWLSGDEERGSDTGYLIPSADLGYGSLSGGKLKFKAEGDERTSYVTQVTGNWGSVFRGILVVRDQDTPANNKVVFVCDKAFSSLQGVTGIKVGGRTYTDKSTGTTPLKDGVTYEFKVGNIQWVRDVFAGKEVELEMVGASVTLTRTGRSNVVVAEGFNSRNQAQYYANRQNNGLAGPMNQVGRILGSKAEVTAVGVHRIAVGGNNRWTYFVQVSPNASLASEPTIRLSVAGGGFVTLTKQTNGPPGTVEFNQAVPSTSKPRLRRRDSIRIQFGGSNTAYKFQDQVTAPKEAKHRAKCILFELGAPSPAQRTGKRVIGGNDYDLKETEVGTVYGAEDLKFNAIANMRDNFVLGAGDKTFHVYKEHGANNYKQTLRGFSELSDEIRSLFFKANYIPGAFSSPPVVLRKYLRDNSDSGERYANLFSGDQAAVLEDYLRIGSSRLPVYGGELVDVVGSQIDIKNITPGFSGDDFFLDTNLGVFVSNLNAQYRLLSRLSVKDGSPIFTDLNKFVYLTNNDNVSVSVLSEERQGYRTVFSGTHQEHLLRNAMDFVYDKEKQLYVLLTTNGEVLVATDFDLRLGGWARWIFKYYTETGDVDGRIVRTIVPTPGINPVHVFNSGEGVKMIGKLNDERRLGVIGFDWAAGKDWFDMEGDLTNTGAFRSFAELPSIINPVSPFDLSLYPGYISLVSADMDMDQNENFRVQIGYFATGWREPIWRDTQVKTLSGETANISPIIPVKALARAVRGYSPRICISQTDVNDVGSAIHRVSMTGAIDGGGS